MNAITNISNHKPVRAKFYAGFNTSIRRMRDLLPPMPILDRVERTAEFNAGHDAACMVCSRNSTQSEVDREIARAWRAYAGTAAGSSVTDRIVEDKDRFTPAD